MLDIDISILIVGPILLITALGAICTMLLMKEIRTSYPELHSRIGLFANPSIRKEFRFHRFILLREYQSLPSDRIKRYGNIIFFCLVANMLLFSCFLYVNLSK
jgi:hypothetical protein